MLDPLFQLKTLLPLRARLAVCLLLTMLASTLLGMHAELRSGLATGTLSRPAPVIDARVAKPHEAMKRTDRQPNAWVGGRVAIGTGGPPEPTEARADAQAGAWADLDRDVPPARRIVLRKLPAPAGADGEDAAGRSAPLAYFSRAPPSRA